MASLFDTIAAAVNRTYERRVRRASLITEYGVHHAAHAHAEPAEGEAEITNLLPGALAADDTASISHEPLHTSVPPVDDPVEAVPAVQTRPATEEEATISNLPPGTQT